MKWARLPFLSRMCKHVAMTPYLTDFQCFWKKVTRKPYNPGTLVEHIWMSASLISSFLNSLFSSSFTYVVTILSMYFKATYFYCHNGFVIMKRFAKCLQNLLSITSTSSHQFLFSSNTPYFVLSLSYCSLGMKINFIFMSPSGNQSTRNLCF